MPHPELDPALVKAAADRRGRPHVFETFDPERTALVVIDLQRTFMEVGAPSEVPATREMVPRLNALAAALRARGGTIAWVQATFEKGGWPIFFDHMLKPEISERILSALRPGHPLHELGAGLDVHAEDVVVAKYRLSAFLPGVSALPAILHGRNIDTVWIAGCRTNVCCDSSARDASMTDFKTVMVSDCNVARSDEAHLAALATFLQSFGDVRRSEDLIAALAPTSVKPAAA